MQSAVVLRRATVGDSTILSTLARQTFYDTFTGTCTETDMQGFLDQHFNVEQLEKELADVNDHCYLAMIGNQPVGYLRFMEDYSSFPLIKQWKALELKRIYVLKDFQGKGIAQAIMDFYLQYTKEHQYEMAWLGVWEHNQRAQQFYRKYGFEFSGHTHDFPIGDTPQTDQWFWKLLK